MSGSGEYKTKQREVILRFLKEDGSPHVTIDQVCDYLKAQGQKVGRSTIYRYMEKLVEEERVRKYFIEEGAGACYQYIGDERKCREHFHLKCTKCGRLFHVECEYLEDIGRHIQEHHGFCIDHTKTVFYGTCEECMRNLDKSSESGYDND